MHRKFIALILSAAIAVTGASLTATPARADDTAKVLAGIAALVLLGAAIESSRNAGAPVVTRQDPPYYGPRPGWNQGHYYSHPQPQPQPQPQYSRFDLPQYCLLPFPGYRQGQPMVGEVCLQRYYGSTAGLPRNCRVTILNGRDYRTGYDPACLRQNGFRVTRK